MRDDDKQLRRPLIKFAPLTSETMVLPLTEEMTLNQFLRLICTGTEPETNWPLGPISCFTVRVLLEQ